MINATNQIGIESNEGKKVKAKLEYLETLVVRVRTRVGAREREREKESHRDSKPHGICHTGPEPNRH